MYISSNETESLMKRFNLMEAYLGRFSMNLIVAVMAMTYSTMLQRGKIYFDEFEIRSIMRVDKLSKINNKARQSLYELEFDFDLEEIAIPDESIGSRNVTFSHAQLVVFFHT